MKRLLILRLVHGVLHFKLTKDVLAHSWMIIVVIFLVVLFLMDSLNFQLELLSKSCWFVPHMQPFKHRTKFTGGMYLFIFVYEINDFDAIIVFLGECIRLAIVL